MDQAGEQTPNVAVVLNRDLMFGSRIRGALTRLGLEARFVSDTEAFVDALRDPRPIAIGVIDMNGPVEWETLGSAVQEQEDPPPTLAFGPHVDVEGRRAAKSAGLTRIVSNGQFHSDMDALIDRYRRR